MKILITGSTGLLGKALVRIIDKKKNNLYFITRKKNKKKNNYFCDLNNLKKIKYITNLIKPDVIINLAAKINFIKQTKKIYRVNCLLPKIFSQYCKKNNKHLIHASSISVNEVRSLYNPRKTLHDVKIYAKTKIIAEKYIQKSKCDHTIIRFAGIYGRRGGHHLGINYFIDQAINKKKLIFSGNIRSKRNYVFVNDAAKAIFHCMIKKKIGLFYLGGEVQTFKTMIKKINFILGRKKKIIFKKNNELISNQIIKRDKIFKIKSFSESLKIIKCE